MGGFSIINKYPESANLINQMVIERFPVVVKRIIQRMKLENKPIFDESEILQLLTVFNINNSDLERVVNCIQFIFEQAAYASINPETLFEILLENNISEAHGKVIGKIWASEAADLLIRMKALSLNNPALIRVSHSLNVTLGSSDLLKQQEPTALFQFTVNSGQSSQTSTVEFSHSELYSLLIKLDRIQSQLDALL